MLQSLDINFRRINMLEVIHPQAQQNEGTATLRSLPRLNAMDNFKRPLLPSVRHLGRFIHGGGITLRAKKRGSEALEPMTSLSASLIHNLNNIQPRKPHRFDAKPLLIRKVIHDETPTIHKTLFYKDMLVFHRIFSDVIHDETPTIRTMKHQQFKHDEIPTSSANQWL